MSTRFTVDTTAEEVAADFADEIRGKTVLITGVAPGGLGIEVVRVITKYSGTVIISGRSDEKLKEVIKLVKTENPNAKIRSFVLRLDSFQSVRDAAAEVNSWGDPIDVLVNNAGIYAAPFELTEDGFESTLQVNYLAPFLFTSLIFPRILAASVPNSPARIVNVASRAHTRSDFSFDDYNFTKGPYDKIVSYERSKTATILFANEIARRARKEERNVLACSFHPGTIKTKIHKNVTDEDWRRIGLINEKGELTRKLKSVRTGSSTYIVAAFDPTIKDHSGAYLSDAQIAEDQRAEWARSQESGEKLWKLTETLVGQDFVL